MLASIVVCLTLCISTVHEEKQGFLLPPCKLRTFGTVLKCEGILKVVRMKSSFVLLGNMFSTDGEITKPDGLWAHNVIGYRKCSRLVVVCTFLDLSFSMRHQNF